MTKFFLHIKHFYYQHKKLSIFIGVLAGLYLVIKLFFTPHLLSDIDFSRAYYDRNGQLMRLTLTSDEKYRVFTPLTEINPDVIRATILYEDKYFYYHLGVNPVPLIRAAKNYIRGNTDTAGASTITMQVARIKYNLDTKTIRGKLVQIATAIYIDLFYSKTEIIEAYLNLAPYGGNIEGITAASLIYFHQNAQDISTIEAVTLSTIPQNPRKRGLNTANGLNTMQHMRQDLANRWISKYGDDGALSTLSQMPLNVYGIRNLPFYAPHFINHEIAQDNLNWRSPSNIKTTIDINLQKRLERALQTQITSRRGVGIKNASAILINYKNMEVLAHIGSADYFDKTIYGQNDGVHARRSPGSTLKPLIYAIATDMGYIHSMTLLRDAPIKFGVYAPENSDSGFYGPVLARDALTHSRNIPAIHLVQKIGINKFYKTLLDSGVSNLKQPSHYGISIALGGAEVSMFELSDIYATMANLGTRRQIRTRIDTPNKTIGRILSPEAFFITLDMLERQPIQSRSIPYTKTTQNNDIRHYWKTGTSSSFRDAWTAGIFGDYVLIIWVGNFDGKPNNAFSGARTAAPIYFALANTVIDYDKSRGAPIENNHFMRDELNIATIDMCDKVGGIAGPHCPKSIPAYFIPGVSPIDTSQIYRAVSIDNKSGRRACNDNPDTTHTEIYEFWDSEFLDMFNRAGIIRNTPPPFIPGCDLDDISNNNNAPIIVSPTPDTTTVITSSADTTPITFMAVSPNPSAKIFWFLGNTTLGTTKSGEQIIQAVPIGTHTVRIATDDGAGTSVDFRVIK